MKVLIIDNHSFGIPNIVHAMEQFAIKVDRISVSIDGRLKMEEFDHTLNVYVERNKYDFIFSFNYFPLVAEACYKRKIKYVSWVYDSPLVALYSYTMVYATNYIFLFDYELYREIKKIGLNHVFYLPLVPNTLRQGEVTEESMHHRMKTMQVSFVGSLYNDPKNQLFSKFENASPYVMGYLNALIDIQQKLYGAFILEEGLDENIVRELQKVCPYEENNSYGVESAKYVYANYFLAREVTSRERIQVLKDLSESYEVFLFSNCMAENLNHVYVRSRVDYYNQMPQIFRETEINLNITLRSIRTGIPLRALDIMGVGGFLLTNYQPEMDNYFIAGEEYDYYASKEELKDKTAYYLEHKQKREEIAYQGFCKIQKEFTYEKRLQTILDAVVK